MQRCFSSCRERQKIQCLQSSANATKKLLPILKTKKNRNREIFLSCCSPVDCKIKEDAGKITKIVEQTPNDNIVTVLSIDGGGIRGVIPGVILDELENILKKIDHNEDARVVDYFDVIAGTSTGSIVASMLTLPDGDKARFEASKILELYNTAGPDIFSKKAKSAARRAERIEQKRKRQEQKAGKTQVKTKAAQIPPSHRLTEAAAIKSQNTFTCMFKITDTFSCGEKEGETAKPTKKKKIYNCKTYLKVASKWIIKRFCCKYSPSFLRHTVKKYLQEISLDQTLKHVVIPSFDLKNDFRPFIFSTSKARELKQNLEGDVKFPEGIDPKHELYGDVKLSDVILSSTAAPTYFPHHSCSYQGKHHIFIDGGLAANNPTLLAVCEAATLHGNKPDYSNYLVLSIGTGRSSSLPMQISGGNNQFTCWPLNHLPWLKPTQGSYEWFVKRNEMPRFLEYVLNAKSDMVEIYMSLVFQRRSNYLRIQEYQLDKEAAEMDNTSPHNLFNLITIGEQLLQKPASIVNPDTGLPEEQKKSNHAALLEFAHKLSQARKRKKDLEAAGAKQNQASKNDI